MERPSLARSLVDLDVRDDDDESDTEPSDLSSVSSGSSSSAGTASAVSESSHASSITRDQQQARLPPLLRDQPVHRIRNVPFVDLNLQFTDAGGFMQSAAEYFARRDREVLEDRPLQGHELERAREDGQRQAEQLQDAQEMRDAIGQELPDFMNDTAAQVEYVRKPHPDLERREQWIARRMREDRVTSIEDCMQACPLCKMDISPKYAGDAANMQAQFMEVYMSRMACTNDIDTYEDMKDLWNNKFVPAFQFGARNAGGLRTITWSEVYVHMVYCDTSNPVPRLQDQQRTLDAMVSTYQRQGAFAGKFVGGIDTGQLQLTEGSVRTVLALFKEQRTVAERLVDIERQSRALRGSQQVMTPFLGKPTQLRTNKEFEAFTKKTAAAASASRAVAQGAGTIRGTS